MSTYTYGQSISYHVSHTHIQHMRVCVFTCVLMSPVLTQVFWLPPHLFVGRPVACYDVSEAEAHQDNDVRAKTNHLRFVNAVQCCLDERSQSGVPVKRILVAVYGTATGILSYQSSAAVGVIRTVYNATRLCLDAFVQVTWALTRTGVSQTRCHVRRTATGSLFLS